MADFIKQVLELNNTNLNTDEVKAESSKLIQRFLEINSETDDNKNCADLIEYGDVKDSWMSMIRRGFKVKDKNILVSDVLNHLENIEEIPIKLKESYPNLTTAELSAVLRISTIIFIELEKHTKFSDE